MQQKRQNLSQKKKNYSRPAKKLENRLIVAYTQFYLCYTIILY